MFRLNASLRKELLLLLRDRSGLAVMFIMPMVLVTLMALIQDAPFRDYQELRIPLLLINNDTGLVGKEIDAGLSKSGIFNVTNFTGSEVDARRLVANGDYETGIIIPAGSSNKLDARVKRFVSSTMQSIGIRGDDTLSDKSTDGGIIIPVFFSPDIKKSFKNSVLSSIGHVSSRLETQTMLKAFRQEISSGEKDTTQEEIHDFISFMETGNNSGEKTFELNSVQHNVPAWTLFGMFFIVISLAGSLIKERTDGSYLRIRTMPGSYRTIMGGKIISYLLVCLAQCALMIVTGIAILPMFGLPQLVIGNHPGSIVMVALCSGLAATGYGILVGTIFNTHQQSSTFGAVSVVILAALGGIWVPVYVMPETVQALAALSPLNWGLNAFHSVFLTTGELSGLGPPLLKLILFFIFTSTIAYFVNKFKNN